MNIFTRIKSWFTKENSEKLVEVVKKTAGFLEDHQTELDRARELVKMAEVMFPKPGSGEDKKAYVVRLMKQSWATLKPHVIDILVGVAVNLLKGAK